MGRTIILYILWQVHLILLIQKKFNFILSQFPASSSKFSSQLSEVDNCTDFNDALFAALQAESADNLSGWVSTSLFLILGFEEVMTTMT